MKTLIVPGIQENITAVNCILDATNPDRVVFLGDWADRFASEPGDLDTTPAWLKQNLRHPRFCFLWGNHDIPYTYPECSALRCSGYQRQHAEDIYSVLGSRAARENRVTRLVAAGGARSKGRSPGLGGITWLDWVREFRPVKGLRQIFGHTRRMYPEWKGYNLCLDTGLRHYALIDDGQVTVHETDSPNRIFRKRAAS